MKMELFCLERQICCAISCASYSYRI